MTIKERIQKYFREKSAFRITSDMLFYLLILAVLLPFSRKHVATGFNKILMHRPAIINEAMQIKLTDADYEWKLVEMDGTLIPFSAFRGRVVFLSIWATWCPPCRAEMPNIQRLYDEYGDRLVMILASNEEEDRVRQFLNDNGYDLPVYRMVQNPPEVFQTSSIPTTFLITQDGKVTIRKTGAARWDGNFFKSYLDDILE
ncbi:MAG TPA: TlpA family protein disulfide reductase [Bacteroides sp.]|nr:TlpA family protein disulfide reductase [Bacteroides sp.]